MEGKRLIEKLRLTNLLSYGPKGTEIELQPLNVLIGPNGSGKSNLIEAISLLKAAPTDIAAPIRAGGGMAQWVWKGSSSTLALELKIEAVVSYLEGCPPLQYMFQLRRVGQDLEFADEVVEYHGPKRADDSDRRLTYRFDDGSPSFELEGKPDGVELRNHRDDGPAIGHGWKAEPKKSILSQLKHPFFAEFTYLSNVLSAIQLCRDSNFGHTSSLRGPQRADEPADFLAEDGKNLGMVLNHLLNNPPSKKRVVAELQRFYPYADDITTRVYAGTVETYFHERGFGESTPSMRVSDGTLRYLCLLAILCHPDPPPLICIEDPEIGLHPDILPRVADLLVDASARTQLIVTTHSDILVSALGEVPEAVVVCERDQGGSRLRRLEPERLTAWLEKYSLGGLWQMGELGGNL